MQLRSSAMLERSLVSADFIGAGYKSLRKMRA